MTRIPATGSRRAKQPGSPSAGEVDRLEMLFELSDAVNRGQEPARLMDTALDCLRRTLHIERAAVLLLDDAQRMRFVAWRGLSDAYRTAVEGHNPWVTSVRPQPILVEDVRQSEELGAYRELFQIENIGALGFIPLVHEERLLGKFMIYYSHPHCFTRMDVRLANTIANYVGFAVAKSRTEERLWHTNQQLGAVLRSVDDGISVQSPSGEVVYANQAAATLMGFESPEQLVGVAGADLLSRFQLLGDAVDLPSKRALRTGASDSGVVSFRHRGSGAVRESLVTSTPVCSADGTLQFLVNVFRDVTDQRRVDKLLRFSASLADTNSAEEVGRLLIRHATEALGAEAGMFFAVDEGGQSATCLSALGYTSEALREIARLDMSARTPVTGAMRERRAISAADLDARKQYAPDFAPLIESMPWQSVMAVPVISEGRVVGGLAIHFRSVRTAHPQETELLMAIAAQAGQVLERVRLFQQEKKARDAAEQARQQAAFLANASVMLASSLDYDTTVNRLARMLVPQFADWCAVDLVNDTAEEGTSEVVIFHQDAEKLALARRLRRQYRRRDDSRSLVQAVIRDGQPRLVSEMTDEHVQRAAQDAEHLRLLRQLDPRSLMVLPLNARGRTFGAVVFATSESGRVYRERDLEFAEQLALRISTAIDHAILYRAESEARTRAAEAYEKAKLAERRKDDFLAMLGHEMRNPLAPIMTALELWELRGDGAGHQEREVIRRHVEHLMRLVDDLLDVSRITRGLLQIEREPVRITEVIERALELAAPLIAQKGHTVSTRYSREDLYVTGDAHRLTQVVTNLLTNAAKYTNPGGRIEVEAHATPEDVELTVTDDGIGLDSAFQDHVFDLFQQAPQAIDRHIGGLGLGLTIVRRLVELHGGQVRARSPGPGRGTTFTVRLPLTQSEERPAESLATAPVTATDTGHRVLVVDDNVDAAEMLALALRTRGHVTETVYDGKQALEAFTGFRPDVALLDIGLPSLDGYELAQELRSRAGKRALKLVAITGYGQISDIERALRVGFDAHLVKPVELADLFKIIQ